MTNQNKIWMAVAALLLIALYFLPIWSIQLHAPQYPEGIGMNIHINNVKGKTDHDLQNINGLNHYIGMKHISKEAIPELKVMPYIFGFLIVFGLIAAVSGNRKLVWAWIITFILLAIIGLIDFYIWEYNYGHHLNPNAPIKVPGMSYQPPLLGKKQLLNITAISLPHIGFYIALLSMGMGGWVLWKSKKKKPALAHS